MIDAYNYPEFHFLLELAKEFRNIYLGTMCLIMYKGIQESVKAIGSKRLLFGTGNAFTVSFLWPYYCKRGRNLATSKEKYFLFEC